MPILNTNEFKVESKLHYIWRRTKEKGKQVLEYASENKETIAMVTPIVLGAIGVGKKVIGGVARNRRIHEERDLKDYRVYDRRLGAYLRLKKPLKNSDWKKITPRIQKGERLVDILQKMDMLK